MPPEEEELKEDVKEESSASSTAESKESQETSVLTESQSVETQEVDEKDEKGVPWKNREAELRRKVQEEMQPWIQQQIQEGIRQGLPAQTAQPQTPPDPVQTQLAPYSDDQLEAMAENNPEWKYAIRKELTRRIEERASERAYQRIQGETKKDRMEREQAESIGYIRQTFPEAFINIGGQGMWNSQNSLVQRAFAIYNSDPSFKNHGMGLKAAFLQAKGELAITDSGNLTKQKLKLTAQQRRQEKQESQAIQSGGSSAPAPQGNSNKVKLAKLMEQHKKTGDPQTFAEILKLKGAMPVFD